jgi:multidrug efflux pump
MAARDKLIELAGKDSSLTRVRHNGLDDSPQLQIDIDQRKARRWAFPSTTSTIHCKRPGVPATSMTLWTAVA